MNALVVFVIYGQEEKHLHSGWIYSNMKYWLFAVAGQSAEFAGRFCSIGKVIKCAGLLGSMP